MLRPARAAALAATLLTSTSALAQPTPSGPGAPETPSSAPVPPAPASPQDTERHEAIAARERAAWPEEKAAPGTKPLGLESVEDPFKGEDGLHFAMHGYFRAPLRIGWQPRGDGAKPGEGRTNYRTPWLVDDDYFRSGFRYTHIQESDWAELYLMAGNQRVTGTVTLLASLFSDSARPFIDRQMGLSQAWVTMRWAPEFFGGTLHVRLKAGSFWDRFGWLPKYDTYMFGRTHQIGEQLRATWIKDDLRVTALHGFGARLEAIDANQGFTMLNYVHLGAAWRERIEAGVYYLDSWSRDKRQLKELTDADMDVTGVDARVSAGPFGSLYGALSRVSARNATFLAPAIEVMHSYGGRGLTENYLGTQRSENGTGSLGNIGFQYDIGAARLLRSVAPQYVKLLNGGDVTLSLFGLYAYTRSAQVSATPADNRDRTKQWKWGAETAIWPLPWIGASLRYDRVIADTDDDASGFRILSPRVTLRYRHALGEGQIYVQYSRYIYGDRVRLRPGQIPLENLPDDHAVKVQAQIVF